MPYSGVDDPETVRKIDDCVKKVMDKDSSLDKSNAIAICRSSIEGKEVTSRVENILASIINKAGARHSKTDQQKIQEMHDHAVDLGASCPMLVFKQDDGKHRWVTFSSTSYQDRDREIISTRAQQADCDRMDKTKEYGPLRWWHVGSPIADDVNDWQTYKAGKGLDIGMCDFCMMEGRVRIESGTFFDERVGARLKEIANMLSVSIGYSHPADQPKGGVFENTKTLERSLLPVGKQSNYLASVPYIIKESKMTTILEKVKELGKLLGDKSLADSVVKLAQETDKAGEIVGLSYKELRSKAATMTDEEFELAVKEYAKKTIPADKMPPDPDEPDADDEEKETEEKSDEKKMSKKESSDLVAALTAIQTALQTSQKESEKVNARLKQAEDNDVKIATVLKEINAAQSKIEKSVKGLVGDLSKTAAKSYRASQAQDTEVSAEVSEKQGPDKNNVKSKEDQHFNSFLDFAISGSRNGDQPPNG